MRNGPTKCRVAARPGAAERRTSRTHLARLSVGTRHSGRPSPKSTSDDSLPSSPCKRHRHLAMWSNPCRPTREREVEDETRKLINAPRAHLMYFERNLRWKSLRTVSFMKRRPSFFGSRAWFLKTTSSSHLATRTGEGCGWRLASTRTRVCGQPNRPRRTRAHGRPNANLLFTAKLPLPDAPAAVGSRSGLLCKIELSRSCGGAGGRGDKSVVLFC